MVVDLIASEYGWTLEQIYKLTYRQIQALTKSINKRRIEEFKTQASLHNKKIRDTVVNERRFTKEQEAENMRDARALLARKQKEYVEGQKNGY